MASTDTVLAHGGSDWLPKMASSGKSVYVSGTWSVDSGKPFAIGFIARVLRAGVDVTGDAVITMTGGVLTIASGASTYTKTAGDVASWVAF